MGRVYIDVGKYTFYFNIFFLAVEFKCREN